MAKKTKTTQTTTGRDSQRHKNKKTSIGSSHNTKLRGKKAYRGQGR